MPSMSWSKLVEDADVAEDVVLDPGEYDLILKGMKEKQTKAGDLMFACRFAVENGPHKGATVWDNIIIFGAADKQKALQIHMRKLYTLGASAQFLQTEPTPAQVINKIEGSQVIAVLEIDEYNGTSRNQIKTMKANKEAVPATREAAPAPAPAQAEAPAKSPSEEYAETTPATEETATKKRGSIPVPPPA